MSSESPGNVEKREMLNLDQKNRNENSKKEVMMSGDNTVKCLPIRSPLQQGQSPSKTMKRNSKPSNEIPPSHHHHIHPPLLLPFLLLVLVPYAAADGFCSPLLCSCQVSLSSSSNIPMTQQCHHRLTQPTVPTEVSQRCPGDSEKLSKSSTLLKMIYNQVKALKEVIQ